MRWSLYHYLAHLSHRDVHPQICCLVLLHVSQCSRCFIDHKEEWCNGQNPGQLQVRPIKLQHQLQNWYLRDKTLGKLKNRKISTFKIKKWSSIFENSRDYVLHDITGHIPVKFKHVTLILFYKLLIIIWRNLKNNVK